MALLSPWHAGSSFGAMSTISHLPPGRRNLTLDVCERAAAHLNINAREENWYWPYGNIILERMKGARRRKKKKAKRATINEYIQAAGATNV